MDVKVPDKKRIAVTRQAGAVAPSATVRPLPASEDVDLIAQFAARVRRMFALLDALLTDGAATPVTIDALREALHQVAGTAAFFGNADLGSAAAAIDNQMRDQEGATPAFLGNARSALRRVAPGEQ